MHMVYPFVSVDNGNDLYESLHTEIPSHYGARIILQIEAFNVNLCEIYFQLKFQRWIVE